MTMTKEPLTDLLPDERRKALRRDYYLRLGTTALVLAIGLVAAALVLLVPTYVYLSGAARAKEQRLANIRAALASADETALSARLATLSTDAAILTSLSDAPSSSVYMREALAVPRPGIMLAALEYTQAIGTQSGTLSISGIAATRDTLRNYQVALQGTPFVSSADLPVSVFAKDTNISFTITLTLTP